MVSKHCITYCLRALQGLINHSEKPSRLSWLCSGDNIRDSWENIKWWDKEDSSQVRHNCLLTFVFSTKDRTMSFVGFSSQSPLTFSKHKGAIIHILCDYFKAFTAKRSLSLSHTHTTQSFYLKIQNCIIFRKILHSSSDYFMLTSQTRLPLWCKTYLPLTLPVLMIFNKCDFIIFMKEKKHDISICHIWKIHCYGILSTILIILLRLTTEIALLFFGVFLAHYVKKREYCSFSFQNCNHKSHKHALHILFCWTVFNFSSLNKAKQNKKSAVGSPQNINHSTIKVT